jgi:hypothetical protein
MQMIVYPKDRFSKSKGPSKKVKSREKDGITYEFFASGHLESGRAKGVRRSAWGGGREDGGWTSGRRKGEQKRFSNALRFSLFIKTQLYSEHTLADWLATRQMISVEQNIAMFTQLCLGLQYIHSQGCVVWRLEEEGGEEGREFGAAVYSLPRLRDMYGCKRKEGRREGGKEGRVWGCSLFTPKAVWYVQVEEEDGR